MNYSSSIEFCPNAPFAGTASVSKKTPPLFSIQAFADGAGEFLRDVRFLQKVHAFLDDEILSYDVRAITAGEDGKPLKPGFSACTFSARSRPVMPSGMTISVSRSSISGPCGRARHPSAWTPEFALATHDSRSRFQYLAHKDSAHRRRSSSTTRMVSVLPRGHIVERGWFRRLQPRTFRGGRAGKH